MSEILQRAARAIQAKCRERGFNECPTPLVHHVAWAVIEALRDPTDEMIIAGTRAMARCDRDHQPEAFWRAMIETALGGK